jgi:predicted patatin/cPLA2 family phospholipase
MRERAAIVVEGGAMRGIFSVGVLDVFLERGFEPFDLAVGVSAGACNLASHVARQAGRNWRAYFDLMTRREFIDPRRALTGGSVVDLDWLWAALAERDPLDVAAVVRSPAELVVVATSASTGEPAYFRPALHDMFDLLRGSCALPGLYRGSVTIGGATIVDGGVSDPIPVAEAYRRGARRILVVRSRPHAVVKKASRLSSALTPLFFRGYPALAAAMVRTPERYQEAVRWIASPPADCRVVHVAPEVALETNRTTQDRGKLERDYAVGRRAGERALEEWRRLG